MAYANTNIASVARNTKDKMAYPTASAGLAFHSHLASRLPAQLHQPFIDPLIQNFMVQNDSKVQEIQLSHEMRRIQLQKSSVAELYLATKNAFLEVEDPIKNLNTPIDLEKWARDLYLKETFDESITDSEMQRVSELVHFLSSDAQSTYRSSFQAKLLGIDTTSFITDDAHNSSEIWYHLASLIKNVSEWQRAGLDALRTLKASKAAVDHDLALPKVEDILDSNWESEIMEACPTIDQLEDFVSEDEMLVTTESWFPEPTQLILPSLTQNKQIEDELPKIQEIRMLETKKHPSSITSIEATYPLSSLLSNESFERAEDELHEGVTFQSQSLQSSGSSVRFQSDDEYASAEENY